MYSKTTFLVTLLLVAAVCGTTLDTSSRTTSLAAFRRSCRSQRRLICNLAAVGGSGVSGRVVFIPVVRKIGKELVCAVRIRAKVTGLAGRRHGFHIHEYGDISALDNGLSTGPHFGNPEGTPVMHGFPNDAERHWGDFGNLRAFDGTAMYNRVDTVISIDGIIGRGITIHAGRDQGPAEQPTGASGPRIAVCVIGVANPSSLVF